jgi:bacterioferritin (cytochrome b1)
MRAARGDPGEFPTSRRMLEGVLAQEEEHAEELRSMLGDVRTVLGQSGHRSAAADS